MIGGITKSRRLREELVDGAEVGGSDHEELGHSQ
jgi:hypothetical protein